MKVALRILTLAIVSLPLFAAGSKTFDKTKEFREEQKGYLNVKFNTYAQMFAEPKGTKCDWVFVAPEFNADEVRKAGVTLHVASIAAHEGYGFFAGLWGNPILQSFESSLGNFGLRATRSATSMNANSAEMTMMQNQSGAMAAGMREAYRQNPQAIEMMVDQKLAQTSALDQQVDKDMYEEDKKTMGVAEAAKVAKQRQEDRRTKVRNELLGITQAAPIQPAETPKPKTVAPEEQAGFQLVFYVTESKDNTGAAMWAGVATNTTTAEFILLKDGKPILAGRHNSASFGFGGGSGAKCGQALASAFGIKPKG